MKSFIATLFFLLCLHLGQAQDAVYVVQTTYDEYNCPQQYATKQSLAATGFCILGSNGQYLFYTADTSRGIIYIATYNNNACAGTPVSYISATVSCTNANFISYSYGFSAYYPPSYGNGAYLTIQATSCDYGAPVIAATRSPVNVCLPDPSTGTSFYYQCGPGQQVIQTIYKSSVDCTGFSQQVSIPISSCSGGLYSTCSPLSATTSDATSSVVSTVVIAGVLALAVV
eukprot:TRINITY_DN968_c0_g1_i1.p1 TRINITY_DN968_c0_g1~~TRINITY_DN968_c0_g1_i1.p1  ORF type:complete len:228 (-),score=60.41 TRINITY_DN968_c0_g1_i1:26-709(-)